MVAGCNLLSDMLPGMGHLVDLCAGHDRMLAQVPARATAAHADDNGSCMHTQNPRAGDSAGVRLDSRNYLPAPAFGTEPSVVMRILISSLTFGT